MCITNRANSVQLIFIARFVVGSHLIQITETPGANFIELLSRENCLPEIFA